MNSIKRNRTFFTEQAIKEYERRIAPQPVARDYVQEEAVATLNESVRAYSNRLKSEGNKATFLKDSKRWLMEECIYKIFNESLESILDEDEKGYVSEDLKHAMVYNFIEESGGANALINRFAEANVLLSEIAKCVDYYYNIIVNESSRKDGRCCVKKDGVDVYKIPSDVQDDFYKELDTADFGDVSIQISNRVVDAIDKFVTDNAENMNSIKQILSTTKEKVEASKKSVGESATISAKRQISNIKNNRSMNVFGAMLERTARSIMKDSALAESFTDNGNLDVARIKTYCTVSYTMLETVNTANMANIDEQYIKDLIDSI